MKYLILTLILSNVFGQVTDSKFDLQTEQSQKTAGFVAKWPSPPETAKLQKYQNVICAQMVLNLDYYQQGLAQKRNSKCVIKPLFFDLTNQRLFMQMSLYYGQNNMGRFTGYLTGQAQDEYREINDEILKNDTTLDSFIKSLNLISRDGLQFKQERYVDGTITVTPLNDRVKLDPYNTGYKLRLHSRFGEVSDVKFNPISTPIKVEEQLPQNYVHIDNLYNTISETTELFKKVLEQLRLTKGEDHHKIFRELLLDPENNKIIASELQSLRNEISTKNYHTMEIIHFLNEFSGLIQSVDKILKSEIGSAPGFITSINVN